MKNDNIKLGRPPAHLTESHIRYAMQNSYGNKDAARFLNIDYGTYKKYSKLFVDGETGKTLFELHSKVGVKNTADKKKQRSHGKSFDCNRGYREKLEDILDGKYPGYNTKKLRKRLLLSGWVPCVCSSCGWDEPRITDGNYPLLIDFIDNNWRNTKLENIRLLCFNCYFNLVRTPSTSYQGWTYGTVSKTPWYGSRDPNGVKNNNNNNSSRTEDLKSLLDYFFNDEDS